MALLSRFLSASPKPWGGRGREFKSRRSDQYVGASQSLHFLKCRFFSKIFLIELDMENKTLWGFFVCCDKRLGTSPVWLWPEWQKKRFSQLAVIEDEFDSFFYLKSPVIGRLKAFVHFAFF